MIVDIPPVDRDAAIANLALHARASPLGLGVYLGAQPNAKPFLTPPHLLALNRAIVEAVHGERRRLLVSMPPQHGKSRTTSVLTPAWFLGTFPHRGVLLASYAAKLAKSWGRQARSILDATGRETYGVAIDDDAASAGEWRIAGHEGGMVSAGIAGDFRGRPGDLVIVDDPIKDSKQAQSPGYLDMLWEWFTSVIEGRLAKGATVIVTATRLHERDLTGRIKAEFGDDWDEIILPAIAKKGDALGRPEGAALWPERFPAEFLAKRRKTVGSYWWAAEYQQEPVPAGGMIVNPAWWRYFAKPPPRFDYLFTSWDMNLKATTAGSYACGLAFGVVGPDIYVLGRRRGRWGFDRLLVEFERLAKAFPQANRHLVEDAAVGPAAMTLLRKKIPGILPQKVAGQGSKVARLRGVSPTIEAGNLILPSPDRPGAEWVKDFVANLAAFPLGDGTDDGDAFSQGVAYVGRSVGVSVSSSAGDARRGEASAHRPRVLRPVRRVSLWDGPPPSGGSGSFGRVK